jgi:putative hydrolase of the HAD superfamily
MAMERCGLGEIFRFVVFSQDDGVEKPAPKLFDIAVDKAGCSIHELLHVGDSLDNDVAGATRAGIRCVWLNRIGAQIDSSVHVDYEIQSLSRLTELL